MLGEHKKAVLHFSGGKDSTALLYLARPYLDKITVLSAMTETTFPHLRESITKTCQKLGAQLEIVSPPMRLSDFHATYGLPSDIVPVDSSPEMAPYIAQQTRLQSYLSCCSAMLLMPLQAATVRLEATLVLRGVKNCDTRKGVPHGFVENGIQYDAPLWDWSNSEVMDYLAEVGAELPAHYYDGIQDSLDCLTCTAHLDHHGKERIDYVKKHYPQHWPDLSDNLGKVRTEVTRQYARIWG